MTIEWDRRDAICAGRTRRGTRHRFLAGAQCVRGRDAVGTPNSGKLLNTDGVLRPDMEELRTWTDGRRPGETTAGVVLVASPPANDDSNCTKRGRDYIELVVSIAREPRSCPVNRRGSSW